MYSLSPYLLSLRERISTWFANWKKGFLEARAERRRRRKELKEASRLDKQKLKVMEAEARAEGYAQAKIEQARLSGIRKARPWTEKLKDVGKEINAISESISPATTTRTSSGSTNTKAAEEYEKLGDYHASLGHHKQAANYYTLASKAREKSERIKAENPKPERSAMDMGVLKDDPVIAKYKEGGGMPDLLAGDPIMGKKDKKEKKGMGSFWD